MYMLLYASCALKSPAKLSQMHKVQLPHMLPQLLQPRHYLFQKPPLQVLIIQIRLAQPKVTTQTLLDDLGVRQPIWLTSSCASFSAAR